MVSKNKHNILDPFNKFINNIKICQSINSVE